MTTEGESVAAWLLAEIREDKAFVEKYQIEAELGFGAAGVVIGARHRVLDQRVAIKFLLSGNENPEAVARFLREARAASSIRNQHVVRVIDASTLASGIPYLVMEHLDGVDLERMLHQSPHRQLPVPDAIELILQTGEALAECHCAGIVHRDLKPSNLFCIHGADGLPMIKVLDFGIAKLGKTTIEADLPEGAVGKAPQRRVFGSPAYMSPEQFESSTDVDLRSDIWALGVILYEFVTGELPFQETSIYRIRKRVAEDTPRPIRELRRDAPADLCPVILKCMEKDPNQRYSNLADLAKALIPFASPRAQHSVARIVRTVEAPGSDTGALALGAPSGRRSSVEPVTRSLFAIGKPRTAMFGVGALIAALSAGALWFNARRAASLASPSLSAAPAASLAPVSTLATGLTLEPNTVPVIQPVSSAVSDVSKLTSVANPSSTASAQSSAHASGARPSPPAGTSAAAVPSASAEHPPVGGIADAGTNSAFAPAPAVSASAKLPSTPPATTESAVQPSPPAAPSADSKWPVPIIETRKHPH